MMVWADLEVELEGFHSIKTTHSERDRQRVQKMLGRTEGVKRKSIRIKI